MARKIDKKARSMGYISLSAMGVIIGSMIDAMKFADVENDVLHHFLDQLEDGFEQVLRGEAQAIMLALVHILRANVASND